MAAEVKLLAKFGCGPMGDDWNKTSKALKRMAAGLPKSYGDQIVKAMAQAKISLTWIRNKNRDTAAYIRCFA